MGNSRIVRYRLRSGDSSRLPPFGTPGPMLLASYFVEKSLMGLSDTLSEKQTWYASRLRSMGILLTGRNTELMRSIQIWDQLTKDLPKALGEAKGSKAIIVERIQEPESEGEVEAKWSLACTLHHTDAGWISMEYGNEERFHRKLSQAIHYSFEKHASTGFNLSFGPGELVTGLLLLVGIGMALALAIAMPFLLSALKALIAGPLHWSVRCVGVAALLAVSYGFYMLKAFLSWFYGTIEVGIASAIFWNALNETQASATGADFSLKIMAGIYIVVRGVTNIDASVSKWLKERREDALRTAINAHSQIKDLYSTHNLDQTKSPANRAAELGERGIGENQR